MYETFIRDIAKLLIFDEAKTVPIFKTVYSKTIFTLAVELGSGLGLWLGKSDFFQIHTGWSKKKFMMWSRGKVFVKF